MSAPHVFLIAGEASGDSLGAALMRVMKAQGGVHFTGIGGALMASEGLKSLLPMEELCVMGLWEVIGHLPRLLKLIDGMVEEIEKRAPDVLVTIDLPDFNFRVAKKLKKRGIFKGKIVHYVAPSVWAWRPKRARKIAGFLDGLMCLFPFEPPYFEKHGLRTEFVGHPLIEMDKATIDPQGFRAARGIPPDALCIGALFGSRVSEIQKHAPVLVGTLEVVREQYPKAHIIVPTLPHLEFDVARLVAPLGENVHVVTLQSHKFRAFAACNVALAVSGTVGLELAYMGIPHVVVYKPHPVTALLLKILVKVKFAHLANILLGREVVPECLWRKCTVAHVAKTMMILLKDKAKRSAQKKAFQEIEAMLRPEGAARPSEKAAMFVQECLR